MCAEVNKSKIQVKNSKDDTVFTLTNQHKLTKHITTVPQWQTKPLSPKQSSDKLGPSGRRKRGQRARAQRSLVVRCAACKLQAQTRRYLIQCRIANGGSSAPFRARPVRGSRRRSRAV